MTNTLLSRARVLNVLASAPADEVIVFAEELLEKLGEVRVLFNRSGLIVLSATDSAQGAQFHLGEVLVSEAHVALETGHEGYGMCLGHDLVQALALAVIDAALAAEQGAAAIAAFAQLQQAAQLAADERLLRQVEATRVEIETF
ncbi:MAG: phosphonate C-P lyase system protein PhnG [Anaerolineae bacterium]|nr:phosphonate C-P lyase system protein PhnG [Anaerolineae bacterium]MDW8172757.1 phosphonate C-P lyase system protein PhnG [Anaerolineae bacterium]